MADEGSLYEFVHISEIAVTTRDLLSLNLKQCAQPGRRSKDARTRSDRQVEQLVLQQARAFVGRAREGFVLSVRQADVPTKGELRFLLERVLLDWSSLRKELGIEVDEAPAADMDSEETMRCVRQQLLAFGVAATALGALPRTPAEDVTFPYSYGQPPTYGDIPTPSTPAEMLHRLEEVESMLWKLMSMEWQTLLDHYYGPLRRTYGFFEANARLAQQETERFGVKKAKRFSSIPTG
jgi:hypothetical protein